MRIKKESKSVGVLGKILNLFSNSKDDTYSCDYINNNILQFKDLTNEISYSSKYSQIPNKMFKFYKCGNVYCITGYMSNLSTEKEDVIFTIPKKYLKNTNGVRAIFIGGAQARVYFSLEAETGNAIINDVTSWLGGTITWIAPD